MMAADTPAVEPKHSEPKHPKPSNKRQCYVRDFEEGLVYLFQFPRMKSFPNLSPFCLKLECWLRFAGIKYKHVENLPVMHRSAEGTLPYIELNGQEYDDSAFIIRDLPSILERPSLDDHLTDEEKAISLAFEKLVEYSLYLGSAKFRYQHMDKILGMWPPKFGILNPVFNAFVKRALTSRTQHRLVANGLGRHTDDEMLEIIYSDLRALNAKLGKNQFMMGEQPTKLDASVFAAIALIVFMPFDTKPKTYIQEQLPNLQKYAERIKEKYWPDWDEFTAS